MIEGLPVTVIDDHNPSGSGFAFGMSFASVESIIVPYGVVSFENDAFYSFSGDITIPGSVVHIDEGAFSNCMNLTSVVIPDSITEIGDSAFQWCPNLKYITIPANVTSIGKNAFGREITIYCVSGSYVRKYATKNFLHYITETGFDSANLAVGVVTAVAVIMIVGIIAIVLKRKERTNE